MAGSCRWTRRARFISGPPTGSSPASSARRTCWRDTPAEAVAAGATGAVVLEDGTRVAALFPTAGAAGSAVTVSLRPESVTVAAVGSPGAGTLNALRGTVASASFLGSTVRYEVQAGAHLLRVEGAAETAFAPGSQVDLAFAPQAAVALS